MSRDTDQEESYVEVLACLIRHGAGPTPRQISLISSKAGFVLARKCLLDAICTAVNPLLVGMRLSLLLEDAAGKGNEGQRQVCSCVADCSELCAASRVRFKGVVFCVRALHAPCRAVPPLFWLRQNTLRVLFKPGVPHEASHV